MAEIFLARANGLAGFERYVVLKRILPARDDDPRWVAMFLDEARLVAQMQHPNIAQVFDLGQIGDAYFYTMEYVHGEDVLDILSRTVANGQRVPFNVSLGIAAGAAQGLAYAHDRVGVDGKPLHIVHRDISPANLMVSFDGVVKVLDFGVARSRQRETKTEAGTLMGKVAYLSPEQCQTNNIDSRSDLFSLGIVLYEMITHVRPFKRGTDYETLAAIVRFDPPPPSEVVKNLPPGTDEMVMKALAKNPNERFQTAHELVEAIEAVADAANHSLAPRDLKRYMRELYGTPPEPWRTLGAEENLGTFSGEVIGPLAEETRMRAFPATAAASEVPLLDGATQAKGTPMIHDDMDDHGMTPIVAFAPVGMESKGNDTQDLDDFLKGPGFARPGGVGGVVPAQMRESPRMSVPFPVVDPFRPDPMGTMEIITPAPLVPPRPTPLPASIATMGTAKQHRSWGVVVFTMLAVVGVGLGAMLALGGKDDGTRSSPQPPSPGQQNPSVEPIVEPEPTIPAADPVTDPPKVETTQPPKVQTKEPRKVETVQPLKVETVQPPKPPSEPKQPKKPKKPTSSCTDPLDCQH